jgi:hypothetical protein
MMAPFSLAFALGTALQAASAAPGLEVVARTTEADGRTKVTTLFSITGSLRVPHQRFVYVPKSVCDGVAVSMDEPPKSQYGWRIFVGPVTYAAQAAVPVRADVMLTTMRMWTASGPVPDAPMLAALPTQAAERSAVIDTLSRLRPTPGCTATTLSLEARLLGDAGTQAAERLVEAELWFVHKAPDGKEAAQRQVVRMRDGGRGDFYFDDMNLTTSGGFANIPIAVEVFGMIHTGAMDAEGNAAITLYLTRRYINRKPALGEWPKTGRTEYPTTVKAGEVISFVLPPLADDGGILLGHRFSVRLRIKAVR